VAAMKVTTSAAMRARDVSRPHAEHLADAEAAEASAVRSSDAGWSPARPGEAGQGDARPGEAGQGDARPGEAAQAGGKRGTPGGPRRRSRPRGSESRGRASR
jgi:hypothetical protein